MKPLVQLAIFAAACFVGNVLGNVADEESINPKYDELKKTWKRLSEKERQNKLKELCQQVSKYEEQRALLAKYQVEVAGTKNQTLERKAVLQKLYEILPHKLPIPRPYLRKSSPTRTKMRG